MKKSLFSLMITLVWIGAAPGWLRPAACAYPGAARACSSGVHRSACAGRESIESGGFGAFHWSKRPGWRGV